MEVKKITKQEPYGYTRLIEQVVNNNAEVLEKVLSRLEKLEEWVSEEKPLENEEISKTEGTSREEVISLVRTAFDKWESYESDDTTWDDWNEEHNARDMAINALFREPFREQYTKQVVKERDIAIGHLNELGYSLGEKIEPSNKVITEIEAQEKWLAEAGYNAYNVGIAFGAIKRALQK